MGGKKRRAGRERAELLATFGYRFACGDGPLAYLSYVQITLNLPRVRRQKAADVWLGVATAQGCDRVDELWADALADAPEQVEELHFQINAARTEARRAAARASGVHEGGL